MRAIAHAGPERIGPTLRLAPPCCCMDNAMTTILQP
nr:hypothetical protein [uncultured bacterium]